MFILINRRYSTYPRKYGSSYTACTSARRPPLHLPVFYNLAGSWALSNLHGLSVLLSPSVGYESSCCCIFFISSSFPFLPFRKSYSNSFFACSRGFFFVPLEQIVPIQYSCFHFAWINDSASLWSIFRFQVIYKLVKFFSSPSPRLGSIRFLPPKLFSSLYKFEDFFWCFTLLHRHSGLGSFNIHKLPSLVFTHSGCPWSFQTIRCCSLLRGNAPPKNIDPSESSDSTS